MARRDVRLRASLQSPQFNELRACATIPMITELRSE